MFDQIVRCFPPILLAVATLRAGSLPVPFISQVPPGDWTNSANCGPTSVLMVASYYAGTKPTATQIEDIDDWMLARFGYPLNSDNGTESGDNGSEPTGYDLATIAREKFSLSDSERYANWTEAQLQQELASGYPVIVAVYTSMNPSFGYKHFMVLVGMDNNFVYVNDPGKTNGQQKAYSIAAFQTAWKANANNAVVAIHPNIQSQNILLGTNMPSPSVSTAILGHSTFWSQAFSLTTAVQVSGIRLDLSGYGSDTFTLWITNAIGPMASSANVLLRTDSTLPNSGGGLYGEPVFIPVNLKLGSGTYFIVVSAIQTVPTMNGWLTTTTKLPSSIGAISNNLAYDYPPNSAFPPGSTFFPNTTTEFGAFQIYGTTSSSGP